MRRLPCLLLALLLLSLPGDADAEPPVTPPPCGTLERLPGARHAPRPPRIFLGGGEKQTRDGFGGGHEVRESANFAVKWTSAALSEEEAALVADILEESWALYIDALGHTVPAGADQFRINAYVSSETDNPPIDFDGGYANLDDEGFTYLVISAHHFADDADIDRLRSVLSHEFYHDVQFGTNAYQAESAYWYWEATAEWASQQLYPDLLFAYEFVGAYALATELPVFYTGDPFKDSPGGAHHYGASIFPRHLTDSLELPSLVPESWEAAGADDDPLQVLDGLLPGGDIADAYIEFAPHMALWDFTRRDLILPSIETYTEAYPAIDPLPARIGPEGTSGWVTVPAGREPRAFGANVIEIARPESGELDLAIEVDATGSLGTPGRLAATVVRQADGVDYAPVTLERGAGAAHLSLAEGESSVYLVVAATADTRSPDETFSYRLRVVPAAVPEPEPEPEREPEEEQPEPSPEPEDDEGCSCATGVSAGGPTGVGFAVLIALISLRRRRDDLPGR
jgi:MYXO-CTERM domain-containing protein